MADNKQQEQTAQAPGKKEEKKSQLEIIANDSYTAGKGALNSVIGAGALAASTLIGGLDTFVTAASFPVGQKLSNGLKGKPFTTSEFRDQSLFGLAFSPLSYYGINGVKEIPKAFGLENTVTDILGYSVPVSPLLVGGLTAAALVPAITALYYPLEHLFLKKTFKGMLEHTKKNFYKGLKGTLPLTIALSAAVGISYAMPVFAPYLFPFNALANVLYKVLLSKGEGKMEYKRLFYPSTYLPNFLNPFYMAVGAVKAAYSAANGLVNLIYNTFKGAHNTGIAFGKLGAAAQPAR